jgi:hypothetical protein
MADLEELCPPELIEQAAEAAYTRQAALVGDRISVHFPPWTGVSDRNKQAWRDTILAAFSKIEWHDPKLCCCQHCPHRSHCRD